MTPVDSWIFIGELVALALLVSLLVRWIVFSPWPHEERQAAECGGGRHAWDNSSSGCLTVTRVNAPATTPYDWQAEGWDAA